MAERRTHWWLPIALFLVLATVAGGVLLVSNLRRGQPLEISLSPASETSRQVNIGGAVNSPGVYAARDSDRLEDLITSAGGLAENADPAQLSLTVPRIGSTSSAQRVNINSASAWLLEALPGIGEKLARAIIAYREEKGPFHFTRDLLNVPGITPKIYERVQGLITVGE